MADKKSRIRKEQVLKTICKYGRKCYRKNAKHLSEFEHPDREYKKEVNCIETRKRKLSENMSKKSESEEIYKSPPSKMLKANKKKAEYISSVPESIKLEIKEKFQVDMPRDFYDFWEFCLRLCPTNPKDAFKDILNIQLVGPFDVLSGLFKNRKNLKREDYLCHWRYYYDPPEFQTVLKGDDNKLFHIGYFRDDPDKFPVFVAANNASDGCTFTAMGENLFATVRILLDTALEKCSSKPTKLKKLLTSLCDCAKQNGFLLEPITKNMKARSRKVNSKIFHSAGIVVPVDKNDVGYRPLNETNANLKRILKTVVDSESEQERIKKFEPIQEIITCVQFANDECDYGMGLELGLDLFLFGSPLFHSSVLNLLSLAYQLLKRNVFGNIIQAHLKNRKRDNFSIL